MARSRGGRWSGRPSLFQIEERAGNLIAEFRQRLEAAQLSIPEIPPVPVEYLALTVTDFSVRSVPDLQSEGRALSGLLDPEAQEILYEEKEYPQRQNFTIAHELGHYFLHYLPAAEASNQLTLFASDEYEETAPIRFFRCDSSEISAAEDGMEEVAGTKFSRASLNDAEVQAKLAKIIRFKQRADRFEWEANVFAAGLLMPRELVQWLDKKLGGDVQAMSAELGVSATALRYRLNGMGLRQDENMGMHPKSYERKKNKPGQSTFL